MAKKQTTPTTAKQSQLAIIDKQKALLVNLLTLNRMNISHACSKAGITRFTYYDWIKTDPNFAVAIHEAKQALVDSVEQALQKQIHSGNATSTIYFLKTQGADRGWRDDGSNQSIQIDNIEVKIVNDKKDLDSFIEVE